MTNKRLQEKSAKNPAIHLHAFQDARVFAAALNADANARVILFNDLLENDIREDSGQNEQLSKHSLVIVQSLLVHGVVRNISTLKIVVEEFAHRLQTPYLVISDLFLEDSAHDPSVDMRRNHVPNNWAEHHVGIVVCAKFAIYLTLRVCDTSTRTVCDGQDKMDNKLF